ncbi:MAG: phosphatidate cytidylyltransferase [Dehalococcoidia bacterium]
MVRQSAHAPAGNLVLRLLSAAVGLPLLGLVLWVGGLPFVLIALAATTVALYEALSLLRRAGWTPLVPEGIAWGTIVVAVTAATALDWPFATVPAAGAAAVAAAAVLLSALLRNRSLGALNAWMHTAIGVAYVALPLASIVALRPVSGGLDWLLVAFLGTFATDTGAYTVGKLIGRHRMAPGISPGKTWEGAAGGLLAGTAATVALVALSGQITFVLWAAIALGAAIAVAGQAGDLLESKLKRLAGAKESGTLIPGHGGLLDRLDSLVLVFPLVYYAAQGWPA